MHYIEQIRIREIKFFHFQIKFFVAHGIYDRIVSFCFWLWNGNVIYSVGRCWAANETYFGVLFSV
jgi:hypothetical protein